MLKGEHGTSCPIDWCSRKQNAVARTSGEAQRVVGVNRGLCAAALPAVDVLEQLLGRRVELRVLVDATVSKAAAEKGTSKHMKYLSKTQQVVLFWVRDVINGGGVKLEKVDSAGNVADLLTKPLSGLRTADLRHKIGAQRTVSE